MNINDYIIVSEQQLFDLMRCSNLSLPDIKYKYLNEFVDEEIHDYYTIEKLYINNYEL